MNSQKTWKILQNKQQGSKDVLQKMGLQKKFYNCKAKTRKLEADKAKK